MEEIASEVCTVTPSSQSTSVVRKSKRIPLECRICGDSALYWNYGGISCSSCKMFFRRNAETGQRTLKCDFDGDCQVNIHSRHICSSCRLQKCVAMGMQTKLFRASRSTKNETDHKRKVTTTSTTLVRRGERKQLQQLPTLNLLQSDGSRLSVDQWNLLSNLLHCYDEHNGLPFAERFIDEQKVLPLKLRYKCPSVNEFLRSMLSEGQLIYEKNGDFLSLNAHDRSTLLRSTVKHTGSLGGTLVLYQSQLSDDPCFYISNEIIFGSDIMTGTKRTKDLLDSDMTFVKLALSILAFSTTTFTVYTDTAPVNLTDVMTIIRIQDTYTELAWQYLLYKYGYLQAVLRFSNLIRCIFNVNNNIVEADRLQGYTAIIDYVVEQTEQTLVIDS